jgi:hypothetical protein
MFYAESVVKTPHPLFIESRQIWTNRRIRRIWIDSKDLDGLEGSGEFERSGRIRKDLWTDFKDLDGWTDSKALDRFEGPWTDSKALDKTRRTWTDSKDLDGCPTFA